MKRLLINLTAVYSLIALPLGSAFANDNAIVLPFPIATAHTQPFVPVASAEDEITAANPNFDIPNYLELTYNLTHNTNLSVKAIQMALAGYEWALKNNKVKNKDVLTIVDFTISSAKDRLYVINLKSGCILMSQPVSHGKNSGENSPWATKFSNKPNSLESSLGVFITQNTFNGEHGLSLRISGLEDSNSKALSRALLVHPANYVTPDFIKRFGRAGTSWGCFAVDPNESKELIDYIKDGSVLYAYGNSPQYLSTTKILNESA